MGKIAIKVESEVDVALLNLLTLFKEAEGYTAWSPFCKEAKEVISKYFFKNLTTLSRSKKFQEQEI